jgi:hypothetical protein
MLGIGVWRKRVEGGVVSEIDPLDEAWLMAKLTPRLTGLPMAVWVTPNEGYAHDVRIKVSRLHGGRGRWLDAAPMAVRPTPRLVVPGSLSAADERLAGRWIELNRDTIIDYWDGTIELDELLQRLRRVP